MIPIPDFPDYFVDGTDIISMKYGKRRVLSQRCNKSGYKVVDLKMHCYTKTCKVHRLIAKVNLPDYSEDLVVDHIDRDKTNNSLENLRMVTRSQNLQNTDADGFYYHKASGKYMARIMVNGKREYIGRFNTEEEAREAYLAEKLIKHPFYTHKDSGANYGI